MSNQLNMNTHKMVTRSKSKVTRTSSSNQIPLLSHPNPNRNQARRNYRLYHSLPSTADVDGDITKSSAGWEGWASTNFKQIQQSKVEKAPLVVPSQARCAILLNIDRFTLEEVMEIAAKHSDDQGIITLKEYHRLMRHLIKSRGSNIRNEDRSLIEYTVDQIYSTLVPDRAAQLDYLDFIMGMSCLVKGYRDQRTSTIFKLIDVNDSGKLMLREMEEYIWCVFRMRYLFDPTCETRFGISAVELAQVTTEALFQDLGSDSITLDQFTQWYQVDGDEPDQKPKKSVTDTSFATDSHSRPVPTLQPAPLQLAPLPTGDPTLATPSTPPNQVRTTQSTPPRAPARNRDSRTSRRKYDMDSDDEWSWDEDLSF